MIFVVESWWRESWFQMQFSLISSDIYLPMKSQGDGFLDDPNMSLYVISP